MSTHVRIAGTLLVAGALAIGAYWAWHETGVENAFLSSSDAAGTKERIRIAVDSWVGYYPLCSAGLKRRMREVGYALECVDDKGDYPARMKALADGQYDFAVATVDSYLMSGAAERFPGVIVAVIDESKGGDALVAQKAKVPTLDTLKKGQPRIALTANSPSDYFAKSLAVHFDLAPLGRGLPWRVEVDGSAAALSAVRAGKADAAIVWEPDVSRALADPALHRLIGTEQTQRLIVDVLLSQRQQSIEHPEKTAAFLQQYFHVLKQYRDDEASFAAELQAHTDLGATEVTAMMQGVSWLGLADNAELWLAHTAQVSSKEALIGTIDSVLNVLTSYGDITANPLPDSDPYRIVNSSFIHELYLASSGGGFTGAAKAAGASSAATAAEHAELTPEQWGKLREVATLKLRPITFSAGSDVLAMADKEQLDAMADNIAHYPKFRVEIRGHSDTRGDPQQNLLLSQDRAESVLRYLSQTHELAPNRLRAVGFGGERPLPQQAGETERGYHYRLPRVELVLLGEDY